MEAVKEAVHRHGKPGIFNTDQGSPFTSPEFVGLIQGHGIQVMRGRQGPLGRAALEKPQIRGGLLTHLQIPLTPCWNLIITHIFLMTVFG